MSTLRHSLAEFVQDEDGQSITEYGAIIAFVGVIIAVAFSIANGTLFGAISQSYSSVSSALDATNAAASST
jgi:Flp pilus assembly pilin Flp